MPSLTMPLARAAVLGLALAALLAVLAPARGLAQVDPAGCTDEVAYDPTIPTYESVVGRPLGDGPTGSSGRDMSADIYKYFDAVLAATRVELAGAGAQEAVRQLGARQADAVLRDQHAGEHRQPRRRTP